MREDALHYMGNEWGMGTVGQSVLLLFDRARDLIHKSYNLPMKYIYMTIKT